MERGVTRVDLLEKGMYGNPALAWISGTDNEAWFRLI